MAILERINGFLWGVPALFLLIFLGIYLSFKTRFLQIRKLKASFFFAFSPKAEEKSQGISAFSSVCTALSATIGTGNIAGVAGAIAIGGPGAVFWMLFSSLFSMIIKYAEIFLAVSYREKNGKDFSGGPMHYMKNGLPDFLYPLSFIFAVAGLVFSLCSGNITQINTVVTVFDEIFNINHTYINYLLGAVFAVAAGTVLLGGGKRIFSFCEKFVPFMLILYIFLCAGVIIINIKNIPRVIFDIFYGAFNPKAVTGGAVGSVFLAVKKGFSRGIFSNEAGMGTSPIAYSKCESAVPEKQALLGIFEVFCDTVLVCTLTAFTILSAGTSLFGTDGGAASVVAAFSTTFGSASAFLFFAMVAFFALSSIIGWGLFGTEFCLFLFGKNAVTPYIVIYCLLLVAGADLKVELVWLISETLSAFMLIPNCISLIFMSKEIKA